MVKHTKAGRQAFLNRRKFRRARIRRERLMEEEEKKKINQGRKENR